MPSNQTDSRTVQPILFFFFISSLSWVSQKAEPEVDSFWTIILLKVWSHAAEVTDEVNEARREGEPTQRQLTHLALAKCDWLLNPWKHLQKIHRDSMPEFSPGKGKGGITCPLVPHSYLSEFHLLEISYFWTAHTWAWIESPWDRRQWCAVWAGGEGLLVGICRRTSRASQS